MYVEVQPQLLADPGKGCHIALHVCEHVCDDGLADFFWPAHLPPGDCFELALHLSPPVRHHLQQLRPLHSLALTQTQTHAHTDTHNTPHHTVNHLASGIA
jgi:hypothetical protein